MSNASATRSHLPAFIETAGGRIVWIAGAIFLASVGWYTVSQNLYALGIGMPLGITVAFVGVGLSLTEYQGECLFAVTVLPCSLWVLMYFTFECVHRDIAWPGYVMVLFAVLAVGRAMMSGGEEA